MSKPLPLARKPGAPHHSSNLAVSTSPQDLNANVDARPLRTYTNGVERGHPEFAVGPSTGREYFEDGRHHVDFDKGPCQYGVDVLCKPYYLTKIQRNLSRAIIAQLEIVKPLASAKSLACRSLLLHCTGQLSISRHGRRSWKLSISTLQAYVPPLPCRRRSGQTAHLAQ